MKIGIVFGGRSEEHSVSVKSAREVAEHLDTDKYEPYFIGITKSGAWRLCDGPDAEWEDGRCCPVVLSPDTDSGGLLVLDDGRYETIGLDVVLPVLHGKLGEDGAMQGLLEVPAVANLDADLLTALRRAATDAAHDGVELFVNGGWRSPEYQEQLFHEAISKYGSESEAARWVATPDTSAHVSGRAVDIGPSAARRWLSEHGADYGLCQIYRNEPWHYELRPETITDGCPPMYPDPTHDPRMRS